MQHPRAPQKQVLVGAILSIITAEGVINRTEKSIHAVDSAIQLAIEAVKTLAEQELVA